MHHLTYLGWRAYSWVTLTHPVKCLSSLIGLRSQIQVKAYSTWSRKNVSSAQWSRVQVMLLTDQQLLTIEADWIQMNEGCLNSTLLQALFFPRLSCSYKGKKISQREENKVLFSFSPALNSYSALVALLKFFYMRRGFSFCLFCLFVCLRSHTQKEINYWASIICCQTLGQGVLHILPLSHTMNTVELSRVSYCHETIKYKYESNLKLCHHKGDLCQLFNQVIKNC